MGVVWLASDLYSNTMASVRMVVMMVVVVVMVMTSSDMVAAKPLVDAGLFVIQGVKSCLGGEGYCMLGNKCSVDVDFLPDLTGGHCKGLREAFTPKIEFVCCKYNPLGKLTSEAPTTTLSPVTITDIFSLIDEEVLQQQQQQEVDYENLNPENLIDIVGVVTDFTGIVGLVTRPWTGTLPTRPSSFSTGSTTPMPSPQPPESLSQDTTATSIHTTQSSATTSALVSSQVFSFNPVWTSSLDVTTKANPQIHTSNPQNPTTNTATATDDNIQQVFTVNPLHSTTNAATTEANPQNTNADTSTTDAANAQMSKITTQESTTIVPLSFTTTKGTQVTGFTFTYTDNTQTPEEITEQTEVTESYNEIPSSINDPLTTLPDESTATKTEYPATTTTTTSSPSTNILTSSTISEPTTTLSSATTTTTVPPSTNILTSSTTSEPTNTHSPTTKSTTTTTTTSKPDIATSASTTITTNPSNLTPNPATTISSPVITTTTPSSSDNTPVSATNLAPLNIATTTTDNTLNFDFIVFPQNHSFPSKPPGQDSASPQKPTNPQGPAEKTGSQSSPIDTQALQGEPESIVSPGGISNHNIGNVISNGIRGGSDSLVPSSDTTPGVTPDQQGGSQGGVQESDYSYFTDYQDQILLQPINQNICGFKGPKHYVPDKSSSSSRILGGVAASTVEWCWAAAIMERRGGVGGSGEEDRYICSGALVETNLVLTTATCIKRLENKELQNFRVVLGDSNLWDSLPYGIQFHTPAQIMAHPDYFTSGGAHVNDIGLIRLQDHSTLSDNVCLVCVAQQAAIMPSTAPCTVVGYGQPRLPVSISLTSAHATDGPIAAQLTKEVPSGGVLRQLPVPMLSEAQCEASLKNLTGSGLLASSDSYICARRLDNTAACYNSLDGGSPLACEAGGRWFLAGLVSWSRDCGLPGVPTIFTRVTAFTNWVQATYLRMLGFVTRPVYSHRTRWMYERLEKINKEFA